MVPSFVRLTADTQEYTMRIDTHACTHCHTRISGEDIVYAREGGHGTPKKKQHGQGRHLYLQRELGSWSFYQMTPRLLCHFLTTERDGE
jgi:hypothetical protein